MTREVVKKSVVVGMLVLCLSVCITSCISGGSNQHLTVSDGHPEMLGGIPPKEEWNKTFGGPDKDDAAYDVQQTNEGGFIIGGYVKSFGIALWNPWLIKTDSKGTMEWNKTFDYYSLPSVSGRIWSVSRPLTVDTSSGVRSSTRHCQTPGKHDLSHDESWIRLLDRAHQNRLPGG